MTTQNSGHAPTQFSITTPFRSVRLIEVPDDLVGIVTSRSNLKFKSAPAESKAVGTTVQQNRVAQNEGVLHLCAGGKAWAVKQVSTSNSVYVVQPTELRGQGTTDSEDDVDMQDLDALQTASYGAVTAVAQVGNFLELHPVSIDDGKVERAVVDLLPILHPGKDIDLDFQRRNGAKLRRTLRQLVDDIAAPDEVVLRACARLGVFEARNSDPTSEESGCTVPSTRTLLNVWRDLAEGCAVESVRLDQDINEVKILNVLTDDLDSRIAEQWFGDGGMFDALDLFQPESRKLKPVETCRFVAGLVLTGQQQRPQMEVQEFVRQWTDLVPGTWVKFCTVEALTSSTTTMFGVEAGEGTDEVVGWNGQSYVDDVVFVPMLMADDTGRVVISTGTVQGEGSTKPANATAPNASDRKRKWHERFGAQRSQKQ